MSRSYNELKSYPGEEALVVFTSARIRIIPEASSVLAFDKQAKNLTKYTHSELVLSSSGMSYWKMSLPQKVILYISFLRRKSPSVSD